MTVRLKSAAMRNTFLRCALPVLMMSVAGLVGCDDSGGSHGGHSGTYYHGSGFYDPYYYGIYDYDDYDPIVLPPHNNGGNRPGKPDKPNDDLKPAHPIVEPPGVGNRPEKPRVSPTSSERKRSLPSRSRPSYMGSRGGMRGMRGGGMRGGGGRGGGRR